MSSWLIDCAVLVPLIVWKVSYTEIDFSTYLEQSRLWWKAGVTDYSLIAGASGPCVYPAGHLYFYSLIDWLSDQQWLFNGIDKIRVGQFVFVFIYAVNLFLVHCIYAKVFEGNDDDDDDEVK